MWTILFLIVGVAVVAWVITTSRRTASISRETKMVAMNLEPASSYEQKTNHFQMTPVDMGPIAGSETPFRVNMYNAYMV
jgi:flagellar basal body-associated protein FliL